MKMNKLLILALLAVLSAKSFATPQADDVPTDAANPDGGGAAGRSLRRGKAKARPPPEDDDDGEDGDSNPIRQALKLVGPELRSRGGRKGLRGRGDGDDMGTDAAAIGVNVGLEAILGMDDAPEPVKDGIQQLSKFAGPLQPLIEKILKPMSGMMPGPDMVIKFIQNLLGSLGKVSGGAMLNAKNALTGPLQTVAGFLTGGSQGKVGNVISQAISTVTKIPDMMVKQVQAFIKFLTGGLQKIVDVINDTFLFKITFTGSIMLSALIQLIQQLSGGLLNGPIEMLLSQSQGKKLTLLSSLHALVQNATKDIPIVSQLVSLLGSLSGLISPMIDPILSLPFSVVQGLGVIG